jgi:hypothetical protein
MRRFKTSLAVGATGMLAGALDAICTNSDRTIVVARHASRSHSRASTTALDLDWRRSDTFETALAPHLASGVDLALLWMHGSGDASQHLLLDRLKVQDCLVIHVLSSMAPDPRTFRDALDRDKARCRYRTLRLGAIASPGGGSRWLTHEEISAGAIQAIETASDVIVGTVPE